MVAELSFYREGELFLGGTQIRLLKQVGVDGSIHAAAKNLKMSYQHAWHILDKMNLLSPIPIVLRQKGGKDRVKQTHQPQEHPDRDGQGQPDQEARDDVFFDVHVRRSKCRQKLA